MNRSLGGDHPFEGPDLRQTKLAARGLIKDLQEHFGPKVYAASVVEIVEVAQMRMAVAEANLHHPFAVPLIPRDTGKVGPIGLWHGCTSMLHF
jgi:hypothetical protein